MLQDLIYVPVFRARQQEIIVLKKTNFAAHSFPLIEIIKEKDRKNNKRSSFEIYADLIENTDAEKIFIDLPTYLKLTNSTNNEVVAFRRSVSEDIDARIKFLNQFQGNNKVIPVISSLVQSTGDLDTIKLQYEQLKDAFPNIAFRTFHNTFDREIKKIQECLNADTDILFYDLDSIPITSPLLRVHRTKLNSIHAAKKVLIRSALNSDIQNVSLEHGEVVADADNSLIELYSNYGFNAFGDYVGIKKDDLTSGGTISPGFIIFDPQENWYYGYKGARKSLDEFEVRIVPSVLGSGFIKNLRQNYPPYYNNNAGIQTLQNIADFNESGKSQAKFKKIAMEHYLHCLITSLSRKDKLPLSTIDD